MSTMTTYARRIVRLDSAVEAVLAAFCFGLAAAAPGDGAWRLPAQLSVAVWWAVGGGLLGFAVLLWRWSDRPTPLRVATLALGNSVTALVIIACASLVDAGPAIEGLLVVAAAALITLAGMQALIARRDRAGAPSAR
jgi:hypothetical protein